MTGNQGFLKFDRLTASGRRSEVARSKSPPEPTEALISRLQLTISSEGGVPIYRQIADALRRAIINGTIAAGSQLPSTRELASTLGLSHTVVFKSFEDLISQGYAEALRGGATYVCKKLPGYLFAHEQLPLPENGGSFTLNRQPLSDYCLNLLKHGEEPTGGTNANPQMLDGRPPFDLLPIKEWRTIFHRHCRMRDLARQQYTFEPFGYPPLREAYSSYLTRARAVKCTSDRVIVFFARELRLDLLLRLLLSPGDYVAVEDPGYPSARTRFLLHGARVVPVRVDGQGLMVDELAASPHPFKFVYVTPSHHEPTGAVMPFARRQKLLDWAAKTGAFIIEDDYDSEFRYSSRPVPSLQGMDKNDCVIHLSCLWKILSPLVRIGFLVLPHCLAEIVGSAKDLVERDVPLLDQFTLTDFINEGHLEKCIRRNRKVYGMRRESIVTALVTHLGPHVLTSTESAGMDILIRLISDRSDGEIEKVAAACGLNIISSRGYYSGESRSGEFIIPFSVIPETESETLISRFARALRSRTDQI